MPLGAPDGGINMSDFLQFHQGDMQPFLTRKVIMWSFTGPDKHGYCLAKSE